MFCCPRRETESVHEPGIYLLSSGCAGDSCKKEENREKSRGDPPSEWMQTSGRTPRKKEPWPRQNSGLNCQKQVQGGPAPPPPAPPKFLQTHAVLRRFFRKTPILSTFWAQAPLGSKLCWAPLTKILDPSLIPVDPAKFQSVHFKPRIKLQKQLLFPQCKISCLVQKVCNLNESAGKHRFESRDNCRHWTQPKTSLSILALAPNRKSSASFAPETEQVPQVKRLSWRHCRIACTL